MEMKICTACKASKLLSEFYLETKKKDGHRHECKTCSNTRTTAWRLANPEAWNRKGKAYRDRLRAEVLTHYGNECSCCGESRKEFLGIDHIEGGGTKHRKEIGQSKTYSWLKKNNYPEGYQILCHNCNDAKGFYGYCPHEWEWIT